MPGDHPKPPQWKPRTRGREALPAGFNDHHWKAKVAATLVRRKREQYPADLRRRVLAEVAAELGVNASTVSRYVRDAENDSLPTGPHHRLVRTAEMTRQAALAWREAHGRLPRPIDWCRTDLRRLKSPGREARLAALDEGWVDGDGVRHPYPSPKKLTFRFQAVIASIVEDEQREEGKREGRPPRTAAPDAG